MKVKIIKASELGDNWTAEHHCKPDFEVIVGNVGRVHEGKHENKARQIFNEYAALSKSGYGRVAHESVTLLKDGEPIKEHHGKQDENEHEG